MTDVVAALIWDNDRFLACQRPANKARALLWEFVGGKVEPGETPEEALIRECREELDILVVPEEVFMEVIHPYPDITVRLILYIAHIARGIPKALEHNAIKWITTAEINDYEFCPADKDILAALKKLSNKTEALLYAGREEDYREFNAKLIPNISIDSIMGVRMPALRKLSKTITLQDLGPLPHRYHEVNCLHALIINREKDITIAANMLADFLPYVDNWAVCDLLSPVSFSENAEFTLKYAMDLLVSSHPYTIRFGIGLYMKHFLLENFSADHLHTIANIRSDHYYVKMMIAWYFATALAKQPNDTIKIFENCILNPWVYNKAIQKAIESFRIPAETKAYLRTLRIRKAVNYDL